MTTARVATGRPARALATWLMAMWAVSCAPVGGDEAGSDVPHDQAVATFAAGAIDASIQIASPLENAELSTDGATLDVPVGLTVTGVTVGEGGTALRYSLDGSPVAEVPHADPFVFEALSHGRHHLAVELLDASGDPVPEVRAGVHVRIAVPCGSSAECDDGLACSTDACIADQCRYGSEPACCDHDLECAWGELCSGGACVQCEADGDCEDGDECTLDACVDGSCESDLAEGCCLVDPDCDDGLACTLETCNDGGCVHVPSPDPLCCDSDSDCAPDSPSCVVHLCYHQPVYGISRCRYGPPPADCCLSDAECDDGHPCTLDSCSPGSDGTGSCSAAPDPALPGCCVGDAECDDGDASTDDVCVAGLCQFEPAADFCELPSVEAAVVTELSAPGPNGWIEVFGTGAEAIDLDGWHAAFADAQSLPLGAIELTGLLPPGGYLAVDAAVPAGAALIVLADGESSVVDIGVWGGGKGVAVVHPWADNGLVTAWQPSAGTPGAPNIDVYNPLPHAACADGEGLCEVGGCGVDSRCELGWQVGCCGADGDCPSEGPCLSPVCDVDAATCVEPAVVPGCCSLDTDCADGDPCTHDRCIGSVCRHGPVEGGEAAACCVSDTDCDDGDPCTIATCDLEANSCVVVEAPGPPGVVCCSVDADCDDGLAGTDDVCTGGSPGACASTPSAEWCDDPAACDDGDPCTADACDVWAHVCTHIQDATCCQSEADCSDGNVCTADICDLETGACSHADLVGCCQDGDDCSDGNPCTLDVCSAGNVCHHLAEPGCCTWDGDCADGDPCSLDACIGGVCQKQAAPGCCLVDDDCPGAGPCAPGVCVQGLCGAVSVAGCCTDHGDCADGNPCTLDVCKPGTQQCTHVAQPGGGCCVSDADCGAGSWCRPDHQCDLLAPEGAACDLDAGCVSGLCYGGVCRIPGGPGAPCAGAEDCDAATCEAGICCVAVADFGASCDGDDADLCEWGTIVCGPDGLSATCVETVEGLSEACDDGVDDDCDGVTDEVECDVCTSLNGPEVADDGVDAGCDGEELFGDGNLLTLLGAMPIGSGSVDVVGDFAMGVLGTVPVEGTLERTVVGPSVSVTWCVSGPVVDPSEGHGALALAEATLCRAADGEVSGALGGTVTLAGVDLSVVGEFAPDGAADWHLALPEALAADAETLQLSPQLAIEGAELHWSQTLAAFELHGILTIGKGDASTQMRIAACDPSECTQQPCCTPYHPSPTKPFYLPLEPVAGQVWFPFAGSPLGGQLGFRKPTGHIQRLGGVVTASVTGRSVCSGACCEPRVEPGCGDVLTEACVGAVRPACRWEAWGPECVELAAACPATLTSGGGASVAVLGGVTTQVRAWDMPNPTNPRAVLLAGTTVTHDEAGVAWSFPARGVAGGCASRPLRECVCGYEPECCAFDGELGGTAPWDVDCHLLANTICSAADPAGCGDGTVYLEGGLFPADAPAVGSAGDGRELFAGRLRFGAIDVDISTPPGQLDAEQRWALQLQGEGSFCLGPRCNGPVLAPAGPTSIAEPVLQCALGALTAGVSPEKTASMDPAIVVCARTPWACLMTQCEPCRDDFDGPDCELCMEASACLDDAAACNSGLTPADLLRTTHAVVEACRADMGVHAPMAVAGRLDHDGLRVQGDAPELRMHDLIRALGAELGDLPATDAAAGAGLTAVAVSRRHEAAAGAGFDAFGTPEETGDDVDLLPGVSVMGWGRLPFEVEALEPEVFDPNAEPFDPSWFVTVHSDLAGGGSLRASAPFDWPVVAADELPEITSVDLSALHVELPLRPRDLTELTIPIGLVADQETFGGEVFEVTDLRVAAPLVVSGEAVMTLPGGDVLVGAAEVTGIRAVTALDVAWQWHLDLHLLGRYDEPLFVPNSAILHPTLSIPLRQLGPFLQPGGLEWAGALGWLPEECGGWPDNGSPLWQDPAAGCPRHVDAFVALAADAPDTLAVDGTGVDANPGAVWPYRLELELEGLPAGQRLQATLDTLAAGAAHTEAFPLMLSPGQPGYVEPPLAGVGEPLLWSGLTGASVTPAHPERVTAAWPAHDVWSTPTSSGLTTQVGWLVSPDVGGGLELAVDGHLLKVEGQQRLVGTAAALSTGTLGAWTLAPMALQRSASPGQGWLEVPAEVTEPVHGEGGCPQCPDDEATWEAWVRSDKWEAGPFAAVVFDTRGASFIGGARVGVGVLDPPGVRARLHPPQPARPDVRDCVLESQPGCVQPTPGCAAAALDCVQALRAAEPPVRHAPVRGSVVEGRDVPLTISPTGRQDPARSVRLHFRLPDTGWHTTTLAAGRCGGTTEPCVTDVDCGPAVACLNADAAWHGRIPGDQLTVGEVLYWVEVIGSEGDRWSLPAGAPEEAWRFEVRPRGGHVTVELRTPTGVRMIQSVEPVVAEGRWVHVAAVIADSTASLLVDGVEIAAIESLVGEPDNWPVVPAPSGEPLRIGAGLGGVDEARVWGRARSQAEVALSRFLLDPAPVARVGLVARWTFDDADGSGAEDASGEPVASGVWVGGARASSLGAGAPGGVHVTPDLGATEPHQARMRVEVGAMLPLAEGWLDSGHAAPAVYLPLRIEHLLGAESAVGQVGPLELASMGELGALAVGAPGHLAEGSVELAEGSFAVSGALALQSDTGVQEVGFGTLTWACPEGFTCTADGSLPGYRLQAHGQLSLTTHVAGCPVGIEGTLCGTWWPGLDGAAFADEPPWSVADLGCTAASGLGLAAVPLSADADLLAGVVAMAGDITICGQSRTVDSARLHQDTVTWREDVDLTAIAGLEVGEAWDVPVSLEWAPPHVGSTAEVAGSILGGGAAGLLDLELSPAPRFRFDGWVPVLGLTAFDLPSVSAYGVSVSACGGVPDAGCEAGDAGVLLSAATLEVPNLFSGSVAGWARSGSDRYLAGDGVVTVDQGVELSTRLQIGSACVDGACSVGGSGCTTSADCTYHGAWAGTTLTLDSWLVAEVEGPLLPNGPHLDFALSGAGELTMGGVNLSDATVLWSSQTGSWQLAVSAEVAWLPGLTLVGFLDEGAAGLVLQGYAPTLTLGPLQVDQVGASMDMASGLTIESATVTIGSLFQGDLGGSWSPGATGGLTGSADTQWGAGTALALELSVVRDADGTLDAQLAGGISIAEGWLDVPIDASAPLTDGGVEGLRWTVPAPPAPVGALTLGGVRLEVAPDAIHLGGVLDLGPFKVSVAGAVGPQTEVVALAGAFTEGLLGGQLWLTGSVEIMVAPGVGATSASMFGVVHGLGASAPFSIDLLALDAAAVPHAGQVLLDETFDGEGEGVPAGWQVIAQSNAGGPPAWKVSQGVLAQTSPSSRSIVVTGAESWTDYTLGARLRSFDDDGVGLLFRVTGPSDYYELLWHASSETTSLRRVAGGESHLLALDLEGGYVPGVWFEAEVEVRGSRLQVRVDGTLLFDVTDDAHGAGRVGVVASWNDAVEVDEVTAVAPPGCGYPARCEPLCLACTPTPVPCQQCRWHGGCDAWMYGLCLVPKTVEASQPEACEFAAAEPGYECLLDEIVPTSCAEDTCAQWHGCGLRVPTEELACGGLPPASWTLAAELAPVLYDQASSSGLLEVSWGAEGSLAFSATAELSLAGGGAASLGTWVEGAPPAGAGSVAATPLPVFSGSAELELPGLGGWIAPVEAAPHGLVFSQAPMTLWAGALIGMLQGHASWDGLVEAGGEGTLDLGGALLPRPASIEVASALGLVAWGAVQVDGHELPFTASVAPSAVNGLLTGRQQWDVQTLPVPGEAPAVETIVVASIEELPDQDGWTCQADPDSCAETGACCDTCTGPGGLPVPCGCQSCCTEQMLICTRPVTKAVPVPVSVAFDMTLSGSLDGTGAHPALSGTWKLSGGLGGDGGVACSFELGICQVSMPPELGVVDLELD